MMMIITMMTMETMMTMTKKCYLYPDAPLHPCSPAIPAGLFFLFYFSDSKNGLLHRRITSDFLPMIIV